MDVWTDEEMIAMALGGNQNLRSHLEKYDLMSNEQSNDVVSRLRSRAAEYYRVQLRAKCEGVPFDVSDMNYDFARQLIPDNELKVNEKDIPREFQKDFDPFAYPGVNELSDAVGHAQDYLSSAASMAYEKSNEMNV